MVPKKGTGATWTAELLGQHADFDHPESEAAFLRGQLDGQPTLIGQDAPQLAIETRPGGAVRRADAAAYLRAGSEPIEHDGGRVAEADLLRRKLELHEAAVYGARPHHHGATGPRAPIDRCHPPTSDGGMPSWCAVDLRMTPDQERLREELHDWLVKNLPWEYGVGLPPRSSDLEAEVAFGRSWQARLAADRWVGITWPVELGGRGLGPTEHFVVTEELARARAPELVGRIGINLVAPTLFTHGTEDQRLRWLPPSSGPSSCGANCSRSPTREATWPRCPPGPSPSMADGW